MMGACKTLFRETENFANFVSNMLNYNVVSISEPLLWHNCFEMFKKFSGSPLEGNICEPMKQCLNRFYVILVQLYKFIDIFMTHL